MCSLFYFLRSDRRNAISHGEVPENSYSLTPSDYSEPSPPQAFALDVHEPARFAFQVAAIRAAITRNGEASLASSELRSLCSSRMALRDQFKCIAEIARAEKWSFAFIPDGTVVFTALS